MAYAALASLAQTIDLILNYHQDSISPQFKDQIISINKHVISLQAFLEDFPGEANCFKGTIREVTHAAEDKIEFFMFEQVQYGSRCASLQPTVGPLGPSKSKFNLQIRGRWKQIQSALLKSTVGSSKSTFKDQPKQQYEDYCDDIHVLKEVTKEIQSIAEKVMKFKNSITVKDVRLRVSTPATSSSRIATIHKDVMVGFDNDLMEIKSRLCGESSKLVVVPVVGMGGIGKTTLVRNAYDDPLTVEHFEIRLWVTVSQDYSALEIVSSLLDSMRVFYAKNDVTMKGQKVYQNLKGRRYLIALDDIWSTEAWDDLKMMFPDDGNGSRIILTTRLLDVASYADSCGHIHEMRLMNEDQSWNLLQQKVFRQDPCPVELEYAGKLIARSCRGLPLAIVVISGLLSTVDQTETAWKIISEHEHFLSANDEFDKILSLSYAHLPHYLRPCFLYMGIFPKN